MRVMVLGGGGVIGSGVARYLTKSDLVSRIIIADKSEQRLSRAAINIGSNKISTEILDINDAENLVKRIADNDIVVNLVGPYYMHGTKALTAAIEAGVNYVDVCDDYNITAAALELDSKARKSGIIASITNGISPGAMNILARYAADKLDQVDSIYIYWVQTMSAEGAGPGQGLHGFHILSGNVPQFLGGKQTTVPAGSGREKVKFTELETDCVYVGHSEPVTLPRYIKGVKDVFNKGGFVPIEMMDDMIKMVELGFGGEDPIRVKRDNFVIPREAAMAVQAMIIKSKNLGEASVRVRIDVNGWKNDNAVQYSYQFPKGAHYSVEQETSLPATIATLMIAQKRTKAKGVVPPEGSFDPFEFISELKKGGVEFAEIETISKSKIL